MASPVNSTTYLKINTDPLQSSKNKTKKTSFCKVSIYLIPKLDKEITKRKQTTNQYAL